MLGVDRVGITQPVFDVGDAQLRWPRLRWRHRLRSRYGRDFCRVIEGACVVRVSRATLQRTLPILLAGDCREPLEKTRAHALRPRLFGGARENDLGRAQALCEIMRREADTQLWQI